MRRPEWPLSKYRNDPVGFACDAIGATACRTVREILAIRDAEDRAGVPDDKRRRVLWPRQIDVLEAVRDHDRVAVSSGHKVSKSFTAVLIALWFFCSFPDARVVMSSTTSRQVDQILWRELRMLFARSRLVLNPEPPYELARSGMKSPDFREVVGFTAREAEAVAGISGKNLLYIIDEASGVDDAIFEAIEGNRAGGARLVLFSNPTKTDGEFFEAFHGKARFYRTLRISSEESPNVVAGREVIPGLADRKWIDEKRAEWGTGSPLYMIRVQGRHVLNEAGKIVSASLLAAAQLRWEDTIAEGRLHIGVDPAGEQGTRDESSFTVRRGLKMIDLVVKRGLDDQEHADEVERLLRLHAGDDDQIAVVAVDCEGTVGGDVSSALAERELRARFELVRVKASTVLRRHGKYDTLRDALYGRLEKWLKSGGAIMSDAQLAKDLQVPSWEVLNTKLLKATPKKEIRAILGRSPDRGDSLALAVWEPSWLQLGDERSSDDGATRTAGERMLDPYGGGDEEERGVDRVFDPYGGLG